MKKLKEEIRVALTLFQYKSSTLPITQEYIINYAEQYGYKRFWHGFVVGTCAGIIIHIILTLL